MLDVLTLIKNLDTRGHEVETAMFDDGKLYLTGHNRSWYSFAIPWGIILWTEAGRIEHRVFVTTPDSAILLSIADHLFETIEQSVL